MSKKADDKKTNKGAQKSAPEVMPETMPENDIPVYPDDASELLGKFTANHMNITDGFNNAATNKS